MTENSVLRFAPFSSFISSSFWFKFADIKLDNDRLQEVERCIWGYYSHCEKSGAVLIDCTSFNKEPDICFSRRYCYGYHVNKNTIEGLKNCSRSALIDKYGRFIIERIKNGEAIDDPNLLVTFILLSFCDLKKYVFTYWFAFPAPLHPSFLLCDSPKKLNSLLSSSQSSQLHQLYLELPENQKGFFCFQLQYQGVSIFELKNVLRNIDDFRDSRNEIYFSFVDPSVLDEVPGWPLRNYLFLIKTYCAEVFNNEFKIVSIRGEFPKWVDLSYVFKIRVAETENDCVGKTEAFVGWQRNDEGKLNFKRINLSDEMDPKKLSNCAVSLNLKLVKWRLQPDLDLSILKNTSCLLLGAGTLGCSVARILLAWGIEKITFVDNGIVSYSNPARQSLYTLEDSAKGCYKANAAARSLYLIHPGMTVAAEVLEIPIPGNKFYKSDHVTKLIELIKNHDAVFLLTDSRESRWLPTLLCSLYQKIAITIALGYDSYLVIRHGVASSSSTEKLGCYFCNDVVAPGNSSVDRTLDQQCTVTRPGLSGIASSFGVELFVSLLQHAKKGQASANSTSCLGKIPHSIRGFIADYEQMLPFTPAFNQCIACSPRVLGEYEREKEVFLQKVFADRKYLEEVTALTLYYSVDDKIEFPESSDSDE